MTRVKKNQRGTSLLELIFALGMIVGAVLLVGQLGSVAIGWNDLQGRAISVATSADALRTSVRAALEAGRPVATLSELPSGERVEKSDPNATRFWTEGACLIVKTADGHRVFDRTGGRLVVRYLRGKAKEETVLLARHVTGATFEVVKDARGRAKGVTWRVTVSTTPRAIEGVAAFRADEGGAP